MHQTEQRRMNLIFIMLSEGMLFLKTLLFCHDGTIDFNDTSKTENTRVSYPIYHINNIVKPVSKAGHAKKVIFLTADAFGVLPPVSRLTEEQTKYYFLSGYTAKVAGTERGIVEPVPSFSACFGGSIPDARSYDLCQ